MNNNPTENGTDKVRLLRKRRDSIFTGVCGGLSVYWDIPVFLVRLIFLMLALWGGTGLIVYVALTLIIKPEEVEPNRRLNNGKFFGMLFLFTGLFFAFQQTFIWQLVNVFGVNTQISVSIILFSISVFLLDRKDFLFSNNSTIPSLLLSTGDKKFTGLCGGIAAYFNLDSNLIRMLWIIFTFATAGFGALVYAILLIILKAEDD